jgi:transcriptional regulator GlxA family with amidase domain
LPAAAVTTALPAAALDLWSAAPTRDIAVEVLPDGCRDLIVHLPRGGAPACFVSALAATAETVGIAAGDRLAGVRLRPGAQFDEAALREALLRRERFDAADLLAAVADAVALDARVAEALAGLAQARPLARARAALGVSERSLERLLVPRTGRGPAFWKNLARARRCARALLADVSTPLAALAADHGYADQPHMTRDLRRWFGAPPGAMRAAPARWRALDESGFA